MKKKTFIFYIASLTRGGAERVMVGLANHFAELGHRCYLVTLEPDEGLYEINKNIKQVLLKRKGEDSARGIKRAAFALTRITDLRHLIKKTHATAVISFIGKTNLRAILAGMGLSTKVIVSVRSAPAREYAGRKNSMLAKRLFPLAHRAVFQTQEAADFFGPAMEGKYSVIFNPLQGEYVPYVSKKLSELEKDRISDGILNVVTCGRMDPVKNHPLLIRAFALLKEKIKNTRLTILGGGDCMEENTALARELGLRVRASLPTDWKETADSQADSHTEGQSVGEIDGRKAPDSSWDVCLPGDVQGVSSYLKRAHLFVLTSDYEGMPNALAEAFAMGLPVLACDCPSGGVRALLSDNPGACTRIAPGAIETGDRGLMVSVGDEAALAEAMYRLLTDEGLYERLACAGHEFSGSLLPDVIYGQWEEILLAD